MNIKVVEDVVTCLLGVGIALILFLLAGAGIGFAWGLFKTGLQIGLWVFT